MSIEEQNEAVFNMHEAADMLRASDRAYCAAVLEELARQGRYMSGSPQHIKDRIVGNRLSQSNVRARAGVNGGPPTIANRIRIIEVGEEIPF